MSAVPGQKYPCSEEAERVLLGYALSTQKGLKIVTASLEKGDFYYWQHQEIFAVLKEQTATDVYLFCQELKKKKLLNEVGGCSYIINLVHALGSSVYIEEYIEEIRRLSALRKIAKQSKSVLDKALSIKESPEFLLEDLRRSFQELEQGCVKNFEVLSIEERLKKEEFFLDKHKGKNIWGYKPS